MASHDTYTYPRYTKKSFLPHAERKRLRKLRQAGIRANRKLNRRRKDGR